MEQILNALVVDDEVNARVLMGKYLEDTRFFHSIRYASSADEAYKELEEFDPDIIFLDVEMPGKDGFTFIKEAPLKLRQKKIVFVTAYDHYAIRAIKNQAFDYILKPVNRNELKNCIKRFLDERNESAGHEEQIKVQTLPDRFPRIRVKNRSGILFINPSDILFCKADGNYTLVCTGKKSHLCSMNLGKMAELLNKDGFIRIGRSYIINYEHITMFNHKDCQVVLSRNGESVSIKIPRQHLKDFDII